MNIDEFYSQAKEIVSVFDDTVKNIKASADHICYKCSSNEVFEVLRRVLEENSNYFYQSIISKRRISYLKLNKPIKTSLGNIHYVELSDQKPDRSQVDGFDHIEIYSNNYEELIQAMEKTGLPMKKVVRPHHTTHDINIGKYLIRLTEEPLIEKIKREQMD